MQVAEIQITEGTFMASAPMVHVIGFDSIAEAEAEYARLADLMLRKAEHTNDLPKTVECKGPANTVTVPLEGIRGVGLADFTKLNEQRAGVRDAFPRVFER